MVFFKKMKDGGSDSPVDGYFLVEIKGLFSIVLLKFNKGGREKFHTHAFNALTWHLKGVLLEERITGSIDITGNIEEKGMEYNPYYFNIFPKVTKKDNLHRVRAYSDSWCLSIRGSWDEEWFEYDLLKNMSTKLGKGRVVLEEYSGLPK